MFVSNFEAISHSTLVFRRKPNFHMIRKPPQKFGVKSGLIQNRCKYGKKYITWFHVLKYPFMPTNPLLAAMSFFFYPLFFFQNLVRYLLLNHKTSKSNFCAKLLSCKSNFVCRNCLGPLPRGPPKINFLKGSS